MRLSYKLQLVVKPPSNTMHALVITLVLHAVSNVDSRASAAPLEPLVA